MCRLMKDFEGYDDVVSCHLYSAVSRYDVDKSNFVHFVNSFRRHCTYFTNIARFNENIDRTVREVCDIRPEWIKMQIQDIRNFSSEPSELAILKE